MSLHKHLPMPEDISLLPSDVEKKRAEGARAKLLRKASLAFLIVTVIFAASIFIYSLVLRSQNLSLEQNVRSEQAKISSLSEVEASAEEMSARVSGLKTVLGEKIYFSELLDAVSGAVPADVAIREMTAPNAETVSVSGTARSVVSLKDFLLNLKTKKIFEMVDLRSVSLDQQSGDNNFDLNLKIAKGGLQK